MKTTIELLSVVALALSALGVSTPAALAAPPLNDTFPNSTPVATGFNEVLDTMAFADRDALVEDDPATYYLKKHYRNHPCVLVRLPRIRLDALRDLVVGAHRFVNVQIRNKSDTGIRRGTARRSRDRR